VASCRWSVVLLYCSIVPSKVKVAVWPPTASSVTAPHRASVTARFRLIHSKIHEVHSHFVSQRKSPSSAGSAGRQLVFRRHTFKAWNHKYSPVHENGQAVPFCCPGGRPLRVRIRDSLLGRARQKFWTERCNFRHSAPKPRRQYAAATDIVQRR